MEPKERIAEKAKEMFLQYGFRSVSMDDIAQNMGMSKKTLYQYFSDKDELVTDVVQHHIKCMQEECKYCINQAKDPIHEIFLTLENIAEEVGNLNPMVLYDMQKFHPKSFVIFRKHKENFIGEIIRKNIEWGINEEYYRPEIDIDILCKFRLETMTAAFNTSIFPPGKYNLTKLTEELLLHFTYGLATLKGHKLIQKYNQQRQKKNKYEESAK